MNDPNATIDVLKDGIRHGPFTAGELLDLVEAGEIDYDDVCQRAGCAKWEKVREVLDWEDGEAPPDLAIEEDEATEPEDGEDEAPEPRDPPPASPGKKRRRSSGPPRNPRTILYAGHPSVLSFPFALFVIAGSLAGGYWLHERSAWWIFAGMLGALFGISWILFQRSLRLYLITPKRIEVVMGFIAKSSNEVRIEDVRAINVHTPGLTGLLGVGTVEFASAGGNPIDVAFKNVYAAHRIKGLVRRLQDARDAGKP